MVVRITSHLSHNHEQVIDEPCGNAGLRSITDCTMLRPDCSILLADHLTMRRVEATGRQKRKPIRPE